MKKIFLLSLMGLVFNTVGQSGSWKYEKTVDGIKIFSKKTGNLKEIKIETTFESSLSNVTEAVLDVAGFPNWIYKVTSARIIHSYGPQKVLYRNLIDMPWPVTDRDVVVTTTVKQNEQTRVVTTEDINSPNSLPKEKGIIRIEDFSAKWVFEPAGSKVKGTYYFRSDPGGDVPDWMVSLFVDEGPVASVKALKKLLPAYKGKNTHGIKD